RDFKLGIHFHHPDLQLQARRRDQVAEITAAGVGTLLATIVFFARPGARHIEGHRAPSHYPSTMMVGISQDYLPFVSGWLICASSSLEDCPLTLPPIGQPFYASPAILDFVDDGVLAPRKRWWDALTAVFTRAAFVGVPPQGVLERLLSSDDTEYVGFVVE